MADQPTNERLEAPAGPGYAEIATWDEKRSLPSSVAGLTLLAQLIEARAWAIP
jgi:hypothetical protein